MKLHRFYIKQKIENQKDITLTDESIINQMTNVFRFTPGDQVILFDGSGYDFFCTIKDYNNDTISFDVNDAKSNNVLSRNETYLFSSLVKKDNFEWIAEKATELGVSHIIPIISERSEKKNLNIERLNKIIIEAAEQSGRGELPMLHEIIDLDKALHKYAHIKSIAWHTNAPKFSKEKIEGMIGAYIGPEGGWSETELDLFRSHKVPLYSLGPQVLRSETAVIAVISRLVF